MYLNKTWVMLQNSDSVCTIHFDVQKLYLKPKKEKYWTHKDRYIPILDPTNYLEKLSRSEGLATTCGGGETRGGEENGGRYRFEEVMAWRARFEMSS